MKGHTLVWHESLPHWLKKYRFDPQETEQILLEHIKGVVAHFEQKYPQKIKYWDVVNEAIDDSGHYRTTVWSKIGQDPIDYIRKSFKLARTLAPHAKLFYNDYNIAFGDKKFKKILDMIKKLKIEGIPIDGVGFQMHVSIDHPVTKKS